MSVALRVDPNLKKTFNYIRSLEIFLPKSFAKYLIIEEIIVNVFALIFFCT